MTCVILRIYEYPAGQGRSYDLSAILGVIDAPIRIEQISRPHSNLVSYSNLRAAGEQAVKFAELVSAIPEIGELFLLRRHGFTVSARNEKDWEKVERQVFYALKTAYGFTEIFLVQ